MSAPRWALALLRRVAPPERAEDVLGDLEEAHRARLERRGRVLASVLTGLEAAELAAILLRERLRGRRGTIRSGAPRRRRANDQRAGRGPMRPRISGLDIKLGVRMLVKYPGLTLAGGLALAFAIALGAAYFEVTRDFVGPTLPLEEGERVVGIRHRDLAAAATARPTAYDFARWRAELESVVELGAFRTVQRNLITGDGRGEPVEVAEISASAFVLTRVPPLLGRPLVADDEREGAAHVVVIGHDVWRTRFASGLTLVGGFAIAVGVAVSAAYLEFVNDLWRPKLPLPDGDRIVGIQNWNVVESRADSRALHDFVTWRAELRSVEEPGAFRPLERNLITEDGRAEPVRGVRMSASAFRLAGERALLGRTLVEADEAPAAPAVVVLGHGLWQARFGGDPEVVGSTVRLGDATHTVVGIMPEGFAFPMNYRLWVPLRLNASEYERGESPPMIVFGRLAPGATLDAAQAELSALGARAAAAFPETNEHLRPRVMPYVESLFGRMWWQVYLLQSFLTMVLVVACINVAALLYARTAAREAEIAVRSALGASRGRIVAQLFAEALVLAAVGAAAGLAAVRLGQAWGVGIFWAQEGEPAPFWWDHGLSPVTVLYTAGLAVLGAAVAGILPALKATGRGVQSRLRGAAAGGSGLRFGRLSTGVIVGQVALCVLFLPGAIGMAREALRYRAGDDGIDEIRPVSVEPDFFGVFRAPLLAGRAFHSGDFASGARVAIANRSFVERVLGGRGAVGRRVRYVTRDAEPGPWYEIVGVVPDLGTNVADPVRAAALYHPLVSEATPGGRYPAYLAVRVAGDPGAFAPRLRAVAAAHDPALRLYELVPLADVQDPNEIAMRFFVPVTVLVVFIALLLSAAGIYSLMAFTVSQRTREIGIRAALGAGPRRIVRAIFSRAFVQIGAGVLVGGILAALLHAERLEQEGPGLLIAGAAVMAVVGVIACIVPARRALRIEPTEALREG